MNKQFQKCISLALLHDYFVNSECTVLSLVPIAETNRKMKQLGLMFNNEANVYTLYSSYNVSEGFNWAKLLGAVDELYFFVVNSDSSFLNYSDVPLIIDDNTYYFSTVQGSSLVQKKKVVGKSDRVAQTDLVFNVAIPNKANVKVKVCDSYGVAVINQTIDGTEQFTSVIDLSGFGSGYYTLYINGKVTQKLVAIADRFPINAIGVVRLDLKAVSDQQSKNLPASYSLNFGARATQWIFQIVVTPNKKIEVQSMTIENKDGVTYSGPVQQTIVGGNTASVFTSTQTIALQERYTNTQILKITYNNQFSTRKSEMDLPMPFPKVNSVQLTGKKSAIYASTQIIYV